jgi:hypothetical protein
MMARPCSHHIGAKQWQPVRTRHTGCAPFASGTVPVFDGLVSHLK